MKYINQFHAWGLKTSYLGLTNYVWLTVPLLIVPALIWWLFINKKRGF